MNEDRVLDAIISIVGKEFKNIESKLAVPEIDALEKLKPGIEKVLSSAGFVSESKYNSLKSRADKLEERLNKLEEG
jgi:polyhydroxyalkanoate synthesis regulator phasin